MTTRKPSLGTVFPLALLILASTAQAADRRPERVIIAESDAGCTLYMEGADLVADGCNLHIRNGMDETDTINGTGNLVVGYDEDDYFEIAGEEPPDKSGSHNVVIGYGHTYSSYGGLVVGFKNRIEGQYSSVSGGIFNTASGYTAGDRKH